MAELEYMSKRGFFDQPEARVLDIGSQCLLNATPAAILAFAERCGAAVEPAILQKEAERIAHFSIPRPGERTSYLSEVLDLTRVFYTSYDVCPALKTEIFDLNRELLPERYRGHFHVVLNFGTTEHIINQMNCFRVMHDALAPGGHFYHQLPATGWINHGYFCYHPLFFRQLAEANDYEIVEIWHTLAGESDPRAEFDDVRPAAEPGRTNGDRAFPRQGKLPSYLINAVLRKRADAPFRVSLELATAHASAAAQEGSAPGDAATVASPASPAPPDEARVIREAIARAPGQVLLAEVRRRARRRLRMLAGLS